MSSTVTIVIYMVLLALLGFIYWLVNKKDIFGKFKNQSGPLHRVSRPNVLSRVPSALTSLLTDGTVHPSTRPESVLEEIETATAVLEEMYREFSSEIRQVKMDLEAKAQSLRSEWTSSRDEMLRRIEQMELEMNRGPVISIEESPTNTPVSQQQSAVIDTLSPMESFDARYLEVLDMVHRQISPTDIARRLEISIHEVELVISVMMNPPSSDKSNSAPS